MNTRKKATDWSTALYTEYLETQSDIICPLRKGLGVRCVLNAMAESPNLIYISE